MLKRRKRKKERKVKKKEESEKKRGTKKLERQTRIRREQKDILLFNIELPLSYHVETWRRPYTPLHPRL